MSFHIKKRLAPRAACGSDVFLFSIIFSFVQIFLGFVLLPTMGLMVVWTTSWGIQSSSQFTQQPSPMTHPVRPVVHGPPMTCSAPVHPRPGTGYGPPVSGHHSVTRCSPHLSQHQKKWRLYNLCTKDKSFCLRLAKKWPRVYITDVGQSGSFSGQAIA